MLPILTLEMVYGTVTYYLAHRVEIDEYLKQAKSDFDALRQASRQADPTFYQKMADARRHAQAVRP